MKCVRRSTAFSDYQGLLLNSDLSPEQHELLSMIKESGQNMQSIIEDLLDFTKIDAGKLLIKSELFDLRKLLFTTVDSVKRTADIKKIAVSTEFKGDDVNYYGDKTRLAQIIMNLLTNSVKYTVKGSIRVVCSLDKKLQLTVEDTGIGIPENNLESIFNSFSQIENTYTKTQKGLGLGLAITKQIIELMHGEISVTSTLGAGSTFTVRLPVSYPPNTLKNISPEPQTLKDIREALSGISMKVLIAEDESINRLYLSTLLKKYNFRAD